MDCAEPPGAISDCEGSLISPASPRASKGPCYDLSDLDWRFLQFCQTLPGLVLTSFRNDCLSWRSRGSVDGIVLIESYIHPWNDNLKVFEAN